MNRSFAYLLVLATGIFAGCVTTQTRNVHSRRPPEPAVELPAPTEPQQKQKLVLESVPTGADFWVHSNDRVIKHLGVTPIVIEFGVAEQLARTTSGKIRHHKWLIWTNDVDYLAVEECDMGNGRIQLPWCQLSKVGYEALVLTNRVVGWINTRASSSDPQPLPIYLTKPTSPQAHTEVNIMSKPSGASIYTINEDGSMGTKVGETPYVTRIGFAEEVTPDGYHDKWWCWSRTDLKELWSVSVYGKLRLSCYLVADGFEPEKVEARDVASFSRNTPDSGRESVELRLLNPSRPQHRYDLTLDSIPSGAAIYEVSSDGTIGRKIGTTPMQVRIGLAQQSSQDESSGKYFHKEWKVWGGNLVAWHKEGKDARLTWNCVLFKDGFAPENLTKKEICVLNADPGWKWPSDRTITVPLQTMEAAKAAELLRQQEAQQRRWRHQNEEAQANRDAKRAEAQKEYDEALEAYNKALATLQSARMTGNISDWNWSQMQNAKPGFGKGMAALGSLSSSASLADARREVEIARERLERAKACLNAADWK